MTTLISKDEQKTHEIHSGVGYKLANASMLIVANSNDLNEASEFIEKNGISAVFFDPANDAMNFDSAYVRHYANDTINAIELYNE